MLLQNSVKASKVNSSIQDPPAFLVLTGASGAGKTTLIHKLNVVAIHGVEGINCDRVKLDAPKDTEPTDAQVEILRYWISHLSANEKTVELAVLDTQIRPHRALEVLNRSGVVHAEIVLVDCDPAKRNERLRRERSQPELANSQMDCWAAYLRGQADALNLSIIDTSDDSIDRSFMQLEVLVRNLLSRVRAA